jgi:hypothetical protein
MKRTGIFYLATIAIFTASLASAQPYTEIFTDGWGQGRRFTRPCFTDLDNDGLLDLLLGDHEVGIHHLEQNAVGSMQFSPISARFSGIDVGTRPSPTMTELDNDGRLDLIVGKKGGTLSHYEQDSPGSLSFSLVTENFNGIDVEGYATPRFTDLDQDDLLDLIVGKEDGTLSHYEQNASGSVEFSLVADNFNLIDVGFISTPTFTDLDGDGLLDMIVGVNLGHLHHYEQVSQGNTEFDLVSDSFNGIDVGAQACPTFADLDNDGLLDLMIGDMYGYLSCWELETEGSAKVRMISNNILPGIDIGQHAAPAFTDLDHDGLLDLVVGDGNGTLDHFEQEAVGSTLFNLLTDSVWGIDVRAYAMPIFTDLDGNGLLDMLVGTFYGNLHHYEQEAYGSLNFELISENFNDIDLDGETAPVIRDLNADGLLDLIIGSKDATLYYYVQDAIGSRSFSLVSETFNNIDLEYVARPCLTDLQNDGLLDMIIGESGETLFHYRQNAVGSLEFTLISGSFQDIITDRYSAPAYADINGDGLEDLFVGCYNGGIRYFQAIDNTGIEPASQEPASSAMIRVYPNPFHASTQIRYALQEEAKVQITIYTLLGQKVGILEDNDRGPGTYTLTWDGTDGHGNALAVGSYICCFQAGPRREFVKIMLLK